MTAKRLPVFEEFIRDMRAVWETEPDEARRVGKARRLLEALVSDPTVRAHSRTWPSTEGRKNLLLYDDPDHDFVVNAVVRAPYHKGNIHDHVHAWILYGVVDGTEVIERFDRLDDGSDESSAEIVLSHTVDGRPGVVDLVEPYAIHAEQGGPTRSAALIVRSKSLPGRREQHEYRPESGAVIRRPIPTQVPFELLA